MYNSYYTSYGIQYSLRCKTSSYKDTKKILHQLYKIYKKFNYNSIFYSKLDYTKPHER